MGISRTLAHEVYEQDAYGDGCGCSQTVKPRSPLISGFHYSNTEADPDLEQLALPLHNDIPLETRREILDLKRLKELEKLAGLRLEPDEYSGLLADLAELEEFAARLPEISSADNDEIPPTTWPSDGESS